MKKTTKRKTTSKKRESRAPVKYRTARATGRKVAEARPTVPSAPRLLTPAEWDAMSVEERRARNLRAAALIRSWMDDESGYDEAVWPELERALNEDPIRFHDDV